MKIFIFESGCVGEFLKHFVGGNRYSMIPCFLQQAEAIWFMYSVSISDTGWNHKYPCFLEEVNVKIKTRMLSR